MRLSLLLAAILAAAAIATPATAGPLKTLFGCTETQHSNCVVWYSRGGQVKIFEDAADEAMASDIHMTFAGSCDSACTLFADLLRAHSCITKSAEFGFHKFAIWPSGSVTAAGEMPNGVQPLSYFTPAYSPELQKILTSRGELPTGEPLLYIHAGAAASVWPLCQ
ncbi:MAG TPA: hypothetical protein VII91_05505 [Bauldia sp.]